MEDTAALLPYAVRYALGRRSYCVGQVTEILTRHRHKLDRGAADAIRRDIREHLEAVEAAGDDPLTEPADLTDHWRRALNALEGAA